ncbi:efflux RND transporter periplasmic adaptor subunit [Alteromonadaceae bacterium BrNp21-10]|nr:efflux RND transporter periplasmic adaptor subunit [Alteromonadaceae bacterium BrNp21-10]
MKYCKTLFILCALALTALASPTFASDEHGHHEEEETKGPNGGTLLQQDNIAVEITIYESGIPPEMRVYAYQDGQAVAPQKVQLEVILHRLGDVNDILNFSIEKDYLVSNQVVTEPHSFEVTMNAKVNGRSASWHYESFEGRSQLSARIIEKADIQTEIAGPQTLFFKEQLFGVIAPANDKIVHVGATYRGEVQSIHGNIGDKVKKGQILAVVRNANSGTQFNVTSPINGEITQRFINRGEITTDQALFEVVDLSEVWVELSAFPENIEKMAIGQQAQIYDLHEHKKVMGNVTYIAPVMTGGHIARARVLLNNQQGHWRPGMHVKADVITASKDVPLAVKQSALQTFRDMNVVFAQYDTTFEVRMLELGESDGDYVEVLSGLIPNTSYVFGNSYILKADVLKDGASHDH